MTRALLEDYAGQRFSPGVVPAGRYSLMVFFQADVPTKVMEFSIAEAEVRSVVCDPQTRDCR